MSSEKKESIKLGGQVPNNNRSDFSYLTLNACSLMLEVVVDNGCDRAESVPINPSGLYVNPNYILEQGE